MVARLAVLILGLGFLAGCVTGTPQEGCLGCHPVHYRARGNCVSCHRGNGATSRKNIAHYRFIPAALAGFTLPGSPQVALGKRLAERYGCRRCHRLAGLGNGLATNLDQLGREDPQRLLDAINQPATAMPDFRFAGTDAAALVNTIMAAATERRGGAGEVPVVVHFTPGKGVRENLFVRKCGGCHRALTAREGGLGTGDVAPDLAGLFSRFYPGEFRPAERWNAERLRRWLANPRVVRPAARMQPVAVTPAEAVVLAELLQVPPSAGDAP